VPIVLKFGNLKLLETFGPVQASNWIALPLPLSSAFLIFTEEIDNHGQGNSTEKLLLGTSKSAISKTALSYGVH
jgi:hypothetical protein